MKPVIAAVAGASGSGTSTLARRAAAILSWPNASFGAYVRGQAARQGLEGSREQLQDLGLKLVEENVDSFCRAVIAQSLWRPGESLIIDGVRHKSVLEAIGRIVDKTPVTLIYIDADPKFREEHLIRRGEVGFSGIDRIDAHKVEWEVVRDLPSVAQKKIEVSFYQSPDPDRSEELLVDNLVEFLLRLGQSPPLQSRITSEFLIRIPKPIRDAFRLGPGDLLEFWENVPVLTAVKLADQDKMRSVFGRLNKELQNVDPDVFIRSLREGLTDENSNR